jgi:hypothetical protein
VWGGQGPYKDCRATDDAQFVKGRPIALRVCLEINMFSSDQCSKWAGVCRYTIPKLLLAPEFHTGIYQYRLYYTHLSFYIFLTVYPSLLLRIIPALLNLHFEHCFWLITSVSSWEAYCHTGCQKNLLSSPLSHEKRTVLLFSLFRADDFRGQNTL